MLLPHPTWAAGRIPNLMHMVAAIGLSLYVGVRSVRYMIRIWNPIACGVPNRSPIDVENPTNPRLPYANMHDRGCQMLLTASSAFLVPAFWYLLCQTCV